MIARQMSAFWRVAAAALAVLALLAFSARAEDPPSLKGVALVIGQSKYEHIAPLANPANDARDMAKLLTDMGFDARSVSDRDARKLSRDLERFVEDAEGADVAFIYYSGHGIESGGENWLVPVDADVSSLSNAAEALVPVSAVMDELKKEGDPVVILDEALDNAAPTVEVRSRRVGGANYQVPREVRPERRLSLGLRWIVEAAEGTKGKPMAESLLKEIQAAHKGEGSAVTKKETTHRMAEANKAFAHFAW